MKDTKYTDLIAQDLTGEISPKDHALLLQWLQEAGENQAEYDELAKVWEVSNDYTIDFEPNIEDAWDQLDSKLNDEVITPMTEKEVKDEKQEETKQRTIGIPNWLKIAASLLLFTGISYLLYQNLNTDDTKVPMANNNAIEYHTNQDEQREFQLPDGSTVWLNENSQLSYLESSNTRDVRLTGEAFFEVAKNPDLPFKIKAQNTETTVLGTSFNLRAYPNETQVEIAVETGLVSFDGPKDVFALSLKPNEKGIYKKEATVLIKQQMKQINASSWKTKKLSFNDSPMIDVITDLERHYETKINTPNPKVRSCHFTGTFEDTDLQNVLEVISFGLDLNVKKENASFLLIGDGCNNKE